MGRTKQQSSSSSSSSFWYSRRRASSAPATPWPEKASASDPPIGCMSMVHYLIFAPGAGCVGRPPASSNAAVVTPHGFLSPRRDDGGGKSGFEAPRNSLDLDADNPNDIQIGVQIEPVFDALARTNMRRPKPTAQSSEAETPRTPGLVARLMGIDGLPDSQQPSPSAAPQYRKQPASSSKKENRHCRSAPASAAKAEKKKRVIPESMNREPLRSLSCNVGGGEARSLPDTPPRASTSARASWDGPRLSLQALKESVLDRAAQYMSMPSSPTSSSAGKMKNACSRRRRQDERAAKEHAREILRQAKENVATHKSSSKSSKSRSSSPAPEKRRSSVFNDNKENVLTSPAAPAPAAVEDKHKLVVVQAAGGKPMSAAKVQQGTTEHPPSQSPCRVPLAPRQPPPPQRAKPSRPPPPPPPLDPPTRARKPDGCERFATRIKKQPAATGGQAPASASASPVVALPSAPASSSGSAAVPLEEDPEYGYLRSVLERGGFMRSPPPQRPFKGHNSVASPVDPIVFHLLELELPADEARLGPLRHRWNRKLVFHLAQELLADLLLGLDSPAPSGPPLLGMVWRKVRSFPAADCRVVGDIDALVAADLEAARVRRLARHPAVAQEAADVAEEVAERVLEALLGECVCVCVAEESGRPPHLTT